MPPPPSRSSLLGEDYRTTSQEPNIKLPSASQIPSPKKLEDLFPPRRHLPFSRPPSSTVPGEERSSRPPSSARDLPPLRTPTLVSDARPVDQSDPGVDHSTPGPFLDPPTASDTGSTYPSSLPGPANSTMSAKITSPKGRLRFSPPRSSHAYASVHASPRSSLGHTMRHEPDHVAAQATPPTSVHHDHDTAGQSSAQGAPRYSTLPTPLQVPVRHDRASRMHSFMDADYEMVDEQGSFLAKPTLRPTSAGKASLARYAAQTEQERQAALNDFICDSLQNDDFRQLCVDVESCWRRFVYDV